MISFYGIHNRWGFNTGVECRRLDDSARCRLCEDEEGFYILLVEKNMILFGGINIYPEEIESVLHEHPAVDEIVVIVKDSYWGEKPVAIVKEVLRNNN